MSPTNSPCTPSLGSRANKAFIGKSSPPVQAYVAVKDAEYKAMVEEVASQVGKGTRQQAPVLAACTASSRTLESSHRWLSGQLR